MSEEPAIGSGPEFPAEFTAAAHAALSRAIDDLEAFVVAAGDVEAMSPEQVRAAWRLIDRAKAAHAKRPRLVLFWIGHVVVMGHVYASVLSANAPAMERGEP